MDVVRIVFNVNYLLGPGYFGGTTYFCCCCWHYYRCPPISPSSHSPAHTFSHLHPAPAPHLFLALTTLLFMSMGIHICSFVNPFTFFHPVFDSPAPLIAVSLFHVSMHLVLFCSFLSTCKWDHIVFVFFFFKIFIVIQLQLYAFSPHPSTPPQLNPPPYLSFSLFHLA